MLQGIVQIDTLQAEAINIAQVFDATTSQILEDLEVLKGQHVGGIVPVSKLRDRIDSIKVRHSGPSLIMHYAQPSGDAYYSGPRR